MALMSVEEALGLVLAPVSALPAERVEIAQARGRVLARPLLARRAQPVADMSAMDGYAVAAPDIADFPATLKIIGESAAGRPFGGRIARGEAVRIFTGALVPEGADTVVIQENVTRAGETITTIAPTAPGRNVRKAGFDFASGAELLPAGRPLTARDVMLAAASDHAEVEVHRRPRVGLLQTGDELVRPGHATGAASEVIVSNVYGIAAIAEGAGAQAYDLGLVRDDLSATRSAIRGAAEAGYDVLVTSGGASVGEHDLIAPALQAEGIALAVHKIALRPGKPLMYGTRGPLHLIGLPGNPVSAYVCAMLFLRPLIETLQGMPAGALPLRPAVLGASLAANDSRMDFMRAYSRTLPDGRREVMPFPIQDSAMLSVLAQADCLVIRRPFAPARGPGEMCEIMDFNA